MSLCMVLSILPLRGKDGAAGIMRESAACQKVKSNSRRAFVPSFRAEFLVAVVYDLADWYLLQ